MEIIFKNIHGYRMALNKKDKGISKTLLRNKYFKKWHREPEFMDLIENNLKQNDIFFDLGTNIGYVSLFVHSKLDRSGKIICVEPDINNLNILNKSIRANNLNSGFEIHNCLISDKNSKEKLYLSEKSNLHSIIKPKNMNDKFKTILIESFTFDYFIKNITNKTPTFIKMDIEGAEINVLEGMVDYLKNVKYSKIIMELHPQYYLNKKEEFKNAFNHLFSNNFKCSFISSATIAQPPIFKKLAIKPVKIYNDSFWKRGLYKDISEEDFYELALNNEYYKVSSTDINIFKRPTYLLQKNLITNKSIRTALFIKE